MRIIDYWVIITKEGYCFTSNTRKPETNFKIEKVVPNFNPSCNLAACQVGEWVRIVLKENPYDVVILRKSLNDITVYDPTCNHEVVCQPGIDAMPL